MGPHMQQTPCCCCGAWWMCCVLVFVASVCQWRKGNLLKHAQAFANNVKELVGSAACCTHAYTHISTTYLLLLLLLPAAGVLGDGFLLGAGAPSRCGTFFSFFSMYSRRSMGVSKFAHS